MPAVEKNGKWYVKRKDGSTGTRGYKTKSNAIKAQTTARKNRKSGKTSTKKKGKKSTGKSNPKKRSGRRGSNMKIGTIVGVVGSAISAGTVYASRREAGDDIGNSLTYVLLGYHVGGENKPINVVTRLARTYGPVVAGVGISKAASRFGVNRQLPKGINI